MATETSTSSSNSRSAGESYIGSFISLISKYEIRYEGVLYHLNVQDSTIGLKNVRSYGTEGRKKDGLEVPPSEKMYEYILFRGSDIKDLQVKASPPAQIKEQVYDDPAIIQSHYAAGTISSSSPSVSRTSLIESIQLLDTPALTNGIHSSANDGVTSSPSLSVVGRSLTETMQWQDTPAVANLTYHGLPLSYQSMTQKPIPFLSTSVVSSPMTMQNFTQMPEINASTVMGLTEAPECVPPVSSIASTSICPKFTPSISQRQYSASDVSFSQPMEASVPSHASHISDKSLPLSSFLSKNTVDAQVVSKTITDCHTSNPESVCHAASMLYSGSSSASAVSGPLLTTTTSFLAPPQSLLTEDQSMQPRLYLLSSMHKMHADQKDISGLPPIICNTSSMASISVTQTPLLPLPVSTQQSQYSSTQFTEEFDFEAMNEKFKKDEVWGRLGKGKHGDNLDGLEHKVTDEIFVDNDFSIAVMDHKPAYKKDEFFDTISCNSITSGARTGHNRFSERRKLNTETFGNIQRGPHPGYGGYGAGRGENYRGLYNWGRGYGYGRRGRWW